MIKNRNEITGDKLITKKKTKAFDDNFDLIFRKKERFELGKLDIALLPVGGHMTMNSQEAGRACMMIKPEIAIPMHYGSVVGTNEDALEFKELCEENNIRCEILEKE